MCRLYSIALVTKAVSSKVEKFLDKRIISRHQAERQKWRKRRRRRKRGKRKRREKRKRMREADRKSVTDEAKRMRSFEAITEKEEGRRKDEKKGGRKEIGIKGVEQERQELVIQGSHKDSGTRCPAWGDEVKEWSKSRAVAPKG